MSEFVKKIDEILKEKNIKRASMCEDVGISTTIITAWDKRNTIPAADVAFKIADYLNVSCRWLVTGIEEKELSNADRTFLLYFHDLTVDQQESILMMIQGYKAKNESTKKEIG